MAAALLRAPASSWPPGGGGCDGRADTCGGPALPWRPARPGPGSPPVIHSLPPDRKAGWPAICARTGSMHRRLPGSRCETISRLHATTAVQVFSGVHPVSCGQAVNKPVDNRHEMRITACFLCIPSWIAEKQEMAGRRALRGARGGSRNAFTAGNGYHPGATPGTREEPGDRPLARVPGPGGRRAARGEDQGAGLPARRGRARPLHLIHGGAVPDSARQERLARAGTPGNRGNAGRDDRGSGRARARFPGRRAGPEAVSAGAAAPAADPCRTAGARARKTGCRAVASRDASGPSAPASAVAGR